MSKHLSRHCALRANLRFASFHIVKTVLRLLFCMCLASAAADADEIVAWKVPLTQLTFQIPGSPEIARLSEPPEKSIFFSIGDVLWNLSKVLPEDIQAVAPDWAVWNANSGRIVAKGSFASVCALHNLIGFNDLPLHCRIKLDASRLPADSSPADQGKKPDSRLELVVRSGQKGNAYSAENGTIMRIEGSPNLDEYGSLMDLALQVSASFPDSPSLEFKTSLVLESGKPLWVARDSDGKSGIDLVISGIVELADGTPYAEAALIEASGKAIRFDQARAEPKRVSMAGNRLLTWIWHGKDAARGLIADTEDWDGDPFAETPRKHETLSSKTKEVKTPKALVTFFGETVIDLTEEIKNAGIILGDGDFAGFAPRSESFFLYAASPNESDKFEQLLHPGCHLPARIIATEISGRGQTRVLTRSGFEASLESTYPNTKMHRFIKLEPVLGINGTLVDIHLLYKETAEGKPARSLETSATFSIGEPLKVMEGAPGAAMKIKVGLLESH